MNTNRTTIRAVNNIFLDPADPPHLNGEAAPEIIRIAYKDTGRVWGVPNADKDYLGMVHTLLQRCARGEQ